MRPDYLLLGHLTADLTPEGRLLGGTVSYAAPVAAAFGLRVGILTSAAQDEPLVSQLQPVADELVVVPASSTSTFENIYQAEGRIQYIRGVAATIEASHIPADWLTAPLVHLAPLTGEVDPRLAACFQDGLVMLTLQGCLRQWGDDGRVRFKRWFDAEVLRDIDIVVFSEEDIREEPGLEPEFAGAVEHLFVTRAERGGTYYHRGEATDFSAPKVEQVNPTGAGDIFAASLLASLSQFNGDVQRAVRVAARLAANSVTRVGFDSVPTAQEVRQALAEG